MEWFSWSCLVFAFIATNCVFSILIYEKLRKSEKIIQKLYQTRTKTPEKS